MVEICLKYAAWTHRVEAEILSVPDLVSFNIVYVENRHSAFRMLRFVPDWANHALLGISLIILGVITYQQVVSSESTKVTRRGILCFVVGAIGNMIDRLSVGAVVDYIDIRLGTGYTLAWNISDLVINLGFAHILVDMLSSKSVMKAAKVSKKTK